MILTGTGDQWLNTGDVDLASDDGVVFPADLPGGFAYEHTYYDAVKLLENMVFGIDIPTIAAINGPSLAHTEFALLCDITLAAETPTIMDPHFLTSVAPGDGLQLCLQELLGAKRAAYYLYTSAPIDARTALDLGLVNEVLPPADLVPRAWEIAEPIMRRPRATRRLTHAHRAAAVETPAGGRPRLRSRPRDVRHLRRQAVRLTLLGGHRAAGLVIGLGCRRLSRSRGWWVALRRGRGSG